MTFGFVVQRKPAPDARVLKIRDYEDKLYAMQQGVQEQHKLSAVADWEHKTDSRIKALNVTKRFEVLKDRRQADIGRRQHELADKLANEEFAMQQELLSSQTTPEQRRAELTARARTLAARREAERQKLAADLYEQQFRENCDLLRGKEYAEDKRRAREQYEAIGKLLDAQVASNSQRNAEEAAQQQQEIDALKARWAADDEAARQAEDSARARQQQLNLEVKEFNRAKQAEVERIAAAEQRADQQLMDAAMRKDAQEEAADKQLKAERKAEQLRYRKHLEALLAKEQLETAERDSMIEAALAEQNATRDAELAARMAARKQLLLEVTQGQRDQIQQHQQARQQVAADNEKLRQLQEAEAACEAEAVAAARAVEYRNELRHRLDIQAQIAAKEQRAVAETDQQWEEARANAAAEAAYQAKVNATLSSAAPRQYFGRRKVEWFT
ncbi:MAG: hypothetical protein FRX49_07619 [Trebouxia sp. A1-2]|nr:MAG: hypothetical protein FRX49_07619 [Trebouxia sp. A1-2]